jgi:TolB-like protein
MKLFEKETGSVLRALDFVFKTSTGVSRPLKASEDHPNDNLSKTFYSDQINKVALAIKEIILGMKTEPAVPVKEKVEQRKSLEEAKKENERKKLITASLFSQKSKKRLIILISVFLCIIGAFAIFKIINNSKQTQYLARLEKSIAVLPFKNDSPNDSNTYFINGIMEEVLNNLQKIQNLRVISRTSVEQYRNTVKSIPEIAKELGVNYIVEGSGQKYGNTFSLRVQLITAVKENHLWAESYEHEIKEVNDICIVQRQIAQAIVEKLKVVVTPQEEDLIQQIPTNNTLAYDYYLKGKQYLSELRYDLAIDMYSKAIEQDPGFVKALLARSHIYSRIYFTRGLEYNYSGDWEGFDDLAKADFGKALKISPVLPEVKYYQADQFYIFERKYDKALEILDEVETQMPNNPLIFELRGAILRRMGQWEKSLKEWDKRIILDPLNASGYIEIAHTYRLMRKYPEALEYYNKSLLLDQNPENLDGKFFTILLWKGDLMEAMKTSELSVMDLGYYYFYYVRQYDKLIPITNKYEDQFSYFPKTLGLAQVYFLNANLSLCRQYADSAIAVLNIKIKESPEDDRYYAALGYAYAYKGENKKAIENAQKAVKLKPLKLDAWQGYYKELDLVKIYILTGKYDLAMDKIEYLLTIPDDLSVPLLKFEPAFDKLRGLPRFKKILSTEYKTNY